MIWDGLTDLLYPRGANCICCGDMRRASEIDGLCPDCREKLEKLIVPAFVCNRCLSLMGKGEACRFCSSPAMQNIDRVFSHYIYKDEVRKLILAFKFDGCDEALPTLADGMALALQSHSWDGLVPVPLHKLRLKDRGVNQSLLLARELSRRTGIPVQDCLVRTVYRRAQSRTRHEKRRANVQHVFACPQDVTGLRLLLIDDVRTTGSTADACAAELRKAGAAEVSLCTAAVVLRRP